ncbi:MAG: hypothetical protein PHQ58_04570 [Rhodoferax sp.]|uniref:hypothetical protein n=1 Tax=Rhodoferax sp. TaxID=50421 RepID=UPI00261213E0|nr:hypothetical protein [Rhodoferax sp.]MDD2879690.1 hypothetical protein [Rhodoferax sp.]
MSFRTQFRIRESGLIVGDAGFRTLHPNVSFPEAISQEIADSFGADLVELKDPPPLARREQAVVNEPAYNEETGRWTQDWTVSPITDPEILAESYRMEAEELKQRYLGHVQVHLDTKAREHGYDDIKSAALRAAYPGPYQQEGITLATWMDECWFLTFELLAEAQGGAAELTQEQLIAQLPVCSI